MQRLLVIRRGAVGDMILTLPVLGALRRTWPQASIELLSTPSRAVLACHPCYATHVADIERLDVHRLFAPSPNLSDALRHYLQTFDLIVAYIPPSGDTAGHHLRRYCPGDVVTWNPHPPAGRHITSHLLQPIEPWLQHPPVLVPTVYPTAEAQEAAKRFWHLTGLPDRGVIAFHLGSGGKHKLWPLEGWERVMTWAMERHLPGLILTGPAESEWLLTWLDKQAFPWPRAHELPLLHLAALLRRCHVMLGHDSGMAHLAAAVGTTTLVLFGPTDPFMWGPRHPRVCVIRPALQAPLTLQNLPAEIVIDLLQELLDDRLAFTPSQIGCTIRTYPEQG